MRSAANQMFSNPDNESAVIQAWERFLRRDHDRPVDALRTLVNVSWQRCLRDQVDPHRHRGPQPLTGDDLFLRRERQRELIEASASVMSHARQFLSHTGTLMALADTDGTILSVEGDNPAIDSAETIRLMPGVSWSERLCGTNAIGTALAAGQPVQVHSAEHFCEGIKRWTCSATVIRHPHDGEVIGVIDVSGLSNTYSRQSLALVVTAASRIESRLAMGEMERRYRLLEHGVLRLASAGAHGAVLFDRRGCPIKVNENAQAAIRTQGAALDLASLKRLPELASEHWRHQTTLPGWLRPEWLEPLVVRGERLGTVLVVPHAGGLRARDQRPALAAAPVEGFARILTRDPVLQNLIVKARKLAPTRVPVLLQGETGVGKEEFARGLHTGGPFVALNCGGLPRELLASELFGHGEGAFTGARKGGMAGKIEAADGGTLFLDEIGEMPLDMQSHLLRVLEHNEIYRLGENSPRRVNFRLVAATHRNLAQEIEAGRFRMDLFYRIAVTTLHIPPLRERRGDTLLLAQHFLDRYRQAQGLAPGRLDAAAQAALAAYSWPGNVRELRNLIEGAVLLAGAADTLGLDQLPPALAALAGPVSAESPPRPPPMHGAGPDGLALPPAPAVRSMAEGEAQLIRDAIAASAGNLTQAARRLGIAKSTLYAKLQRHGLARRSEIQPRQDRA